MRKFIKISFLLFIICCTVFTISCKKKDKSRLQDSNSVSKSDTVPQKPDLNKQYDSFPVINYIRVHIKDKQILNYIRKGKDPDDNYFNVKVINTLNRKEFGYIRIGDTIVVPDTIIKDLRAYSIFPHYYEGAKDLPKIIMVSAKYQCYACYEYGKLVRFAAASTGKEKTQSYPGRYAVNHKTRLAKSSLDSNWIMPFTLVFHALAGSALHQFQMPGYPASHSCIRQFQTDAEWLFGWAKGARYENGKKLYMSGTPVIIIDNYDFRLKRRGLWNDFRTNKEIVLQLPEKPLEVEEALIPIVQIPVDARGMLHDRKRFVYAEDTLRARGIIREGVTLTPSVNFNKIRRDKAERARREKMLKEEQESNIDNTVN